MKNNSPTSPDKQHSLIPKNKSNNRISHRQLRGGNYRISKWKKLGELDGGEKGKKKKGIAWKLKPKSVVLMRWEHKGKCKVGGWEM